MKCSVDKKTCLGYHNGECISIENCMHKEDIHKQYELNLDKVNSVEDCKKILKFLCQLTIKPLPSDIEYDGFGEVSEYFQDEKIFKKSFMREQKEIVDMFVKVADCASNEDEPCPFFDYCECTEEACYKQWEEWLNGN